MWGDFTRQDDVPTCGPSEGPRGRLAGGIAVLVVGLVTMLMGFVLTYSDLRGPNDARGDKAVAFLWVPGAVIAVVGVALFVWGWWRSSHSE
jgi:hypothetical protein